MSRLSIGQSVRFTRVEDESDTDCDELRAVGEVGMVVGAGRYFSDDPSAGYDCIVLLPSYGEYCAWDWQLEPIIDPGREVVEWSACLWQPSDRRETV
jgi:hypothetical protein